MTIKTHLCWLILTSLPIILLAGCATTQNASPTNTGFNPAVHQYGEMRPVMREGQTQPRIALIDAVAQPNTIAVGALEGLHGEITIVEGQVWVSRPINTNLQVTGPQPTPTDQATLLTLAHVQNWKSTEIKSTVEGQALEQLIKNTANTNGIDTTKPFPFIIQGNLTHIDLHVINGYCPIAVDPATVNAQPWKLSNNTQTQTTIVGFYAQGTAAVMTHHGTQIHAHAIITSNDKTITGHIDRVVVEPGMTLRLPSN